MRVQVKEEEGAVYIRFNTPVIDDFTLPLIQIVNKMKEMKMRKLVIMMSTPFIIGDPTSALSAYNFLNGVEGLEITTCNMGIVSHVGLPLYCVGHIRICVPGAYFRFEDIRRGVAGVTKVYDLDEQIKVIKVTRLELAKTIAYKVGKTEHEIEQMMIKKVTLTAEEALRFKLVTRIESKLLKAGDDILSL